MTAQSTVLIVAAHPDDEVLGCGATIAKLSETEIVHVMLLGEGAASRQEGRDAALEVEIERLRDSARSATSSLGVESVRFADLPDNRFDSLPLLDIVRTVERAVEELQPKTIYTHHPGDLNIDHQLTFRAVLTATRPTNGCPVQELYTFEIPSSSEWSFHQVGPAFRPNVFVDVAETIERKLLALEYYESETRPSPHPRSPEVLRANARKWGATAGLDWAEAFELVRAVWS